MAAMLGACFLLALVLATSAIPLPDEDLPFPRHLSVNYTTEPAANFRLPTTVKPLKYNVKLVPYITEGNFTFDGEVLITIQAKAATSSITLHAKHLTVDNTSIVITDLSSGEKVEVTGIEEVPEFDFYTILLASPLRVDLQYTIHFRRFQGIMNNDMNGFYRSSYVERGVRRWLATTQFEKTGARRAFPCFDEPALKARFTISVSRTANMRAISNMPQDGAPVLDTEHTDELRYWDNFLESTPMSTYLVAFVVSDFVYLENAAENFRIFAQPQMISQARYTLAVSPVLLNWLADFTGIDFHLPKMDEVAVPDFDFGAMENWGLVTYRERILLLQDGVSTSRQLQFATTTIMHEYAHQWFGDLVTCDWWQYLWLNEGFATYFQFFGTAEVEPTWRLEEQFVPAVLQFALFEDGTQGLKEMSYDPLTPQETEDILEIVPYEKSGSVIRMMEHMVSPKIFRRGLQRYLRDRSYDTAVADDLFRNINAQLHEDNSEADFDVKTVMDTWTTQMGYPVVMVTRDYPGKSAVLTQERFRYSFDSANPDTRDYKWHIPLTFTTQGAPDFTSTSPRTWFNVDDETKTILNLANASDWVLFNVKESGYYRVNYDAQNWALLTSQLNSDQYDEIHLLNRAQLVDDSFNLARAGVLSYDTPLALSQYLTRETDYVVWIAGFNAFSFIDRKLTFSPDYPVFQDYVLSLIDGLYKSLGLEEGSDDDHVLKLNRGATARWACNMGDGDCVDTAVEKFAAWMDTPDTNQIAPDVKSAMYCTALRNGGAAEYDFLYQKYLDSISPTESNLIIAALGCSNDPGSINKVLRLALNKSDGSSIRRQDSARAIISVLDNPGALDIALDFITTNVSDVAANHGSIDTFFAEFSERSTKQEHADKMQTFLTANSATLGSTAASVRSAIATIAKNQEWVDEYAQDILAWIKNNPVKSVK